MIFREKIERQGSGGGVGAGRCGGGWRLRKEPELPNLNKVNFPAIWPVFRIEERALRAVRVRKLYF